MTDKSTDWQSFPAVCLSMALAKTLYLQSGSRVRHFFQLPSLGEGLGVGL